MRPASHRSHAPPGASDTSRTSVVPTRKTPSAREPPHMSDETTTAVLRVGTDDHEMPIKQAAEGSPAFDIGKLLTSTGMTTLDYGYGNTAACQSAITYIDGDAGILRYRGSPIDQLAEKSTFIEVSY